jgi:hypothetical protein
MARSKPIGIGGRWMDELRTGGRFLRGLRPFLKHPLDLAHARRLLDGQLAAREQTFASILERGVFGNRVSPYRRLFEWAGIGLGDVSTMLASDGLDATLEKLYDAGVYLTVDEFKGRRSITRSGLDWPVCAEDFDNPLMTRHYQARTGGSTGAPRRIPIDLNLLEHESAYHALFYASAGASDRALGIWQPAPPGAVGIKAALMQAKLGRPTARWFSQSGVRASSVKYAMFARATLFAARISGARIPVPEYTPASHAGRVAAWLAEQRATGFPAILVTPASAGVRTCRAALDGGLDIAGTLLVLGGEPYTEAKAGVVAETGSRGVCHYAMVEAGLIGLACQAGAAPDDVHLVTDKIATIQRDRPVGRTGSVVGALFHTTLLPASPKLMLNVESGDYGVRVDRDCECGALPRGFRSHLHTIRSYEKLTSEGMNFLGSDLLTLVEEVLPARFGGRPTDYQFVERERDGLPIVSLVIADAVGELDPDRVVRAVLEYLKNQGLGETIMADVWAQSETLRIVRREPLITSAGKILPLQTLTSSRGAGEPASREG